MMQRQEVKTQNKISESEGQLIDAKTRIYMAIKRAHDKYKGDDDSQNKIRDAFNIRNNFDENDQKKFLDKNHSTKIIESEIAKAINELTPWLFGENKSVILWKELLEEAYTKFDSIITKEK